MPFRIALSGLNAASSELRVIGNNVANAGTTGFKKSRAEFADIYAASSLGVASNAIGSGVKVASVSQQFNQGNISFTDNNLDLAISGQGFFRLSDNGVSVYTRAGAFGVDRDGYVVNSQKQRLTGYGADNNGNITGALGDLLLSTADLAPNVTSNASLLANLDSRVTPIDSTAVPFDMADPSTYHNSTSFTAYDSLGNPRLTTLYFVKQPAVSAAAPAGSTSEWNMYMSVDGTQINATASSAARTLNFDGSGTLTTPTQVLTDTIPATGGAAPFAFTLDLAGTTQFGNNFSVNSVSQDGFTTGRLSGVDIGDTGVVTARYTNGQSKTLAQVALANFGNSQGLRQLGDSTWAESFDSGSALVGAPGTGSLGLIQSGALEGSNVDLTEQLVGMITAQRNYQANAQVIKTADTVTQTIINMR
jgi:flagellar hook protein FlgE